jgi:4-hydroxybenzoate polyprenyltransferase
MLLTVAGLTAGLGWFYLLAVAAVAGQMAWQVAGLNIESAEDCLMRFKSNRLIGWILLAGLLAETAVAGPAGFGS